MRATHGPARGDTTSIAQTCARATAATCVIPLAQAHGACLTRWYNGAKVVAYVHGGWVKKGRGMADEERLPFLSLVIPAFNEAARLPLTLAKIKAYLADQPYAAEVLVVDD